jgi:hypothetical protein
LFLIPEGRLVMAPGTEAGDLSGYMVSASAGFIFELYEKTSFNTVGVLTG